MSRAWIARRCSARAANAPAWTGQPAEAISLVDAAIALVDAGAEPVRAALLHQRRGMLPVAAGSRARVADLERAVALIPAEPPSTERARALGGLGADRSCSRDGRRARATPARPRSTVARAVGARVEEADALATLGDDLARLGDRGRRRLRCCARRARPSRGRRATTTILSRTSDPVLRCPAPRRPARGGRSRSRSRARAEARRAGLEMRDGFGRSNAAEAAVRARAAGTSPTQLVRDVLARELDRRDARVRPSRGGHARVRTRRPRRAPRRISTAHRVAVGRDAIPPDYYVVRGRGRAGALAAAPGGRRASGGATASDLVTEDAHATRALRHARPARRGRSAPSWRAHAATGPPTPRRRASARAAFHATARERAGARGAPGARRQTIEAERARADGHSDPALWDAAARAWRARPAPYSGGVRALAGGRGGARAGRDRAHGRAARSRSRARAPRSRLGARQPCGASSRRSRGGPGSQLACRGRRRPGGARTASAAELGLTPREREVLERLALGRTNRQIADELFISIKTAGRPRVPHPRQARRREPRARRPSIAHRLGLVP